MKRLGLRCGIVTLAMIALLTSCAFLSAWPESVVEGALRSSVGALVPPAAYRSGALPPPLADLWIARAEAEYRRWFSGAALQAHLTGLRNVVAADTQQAGPIIESIDVQAVDTGTLVVRGDDASVEGAAIRYVTHYVRGTWSPSAVPGVTGCYFTLHQGDGQWRILTEGCNVSGG